MRSVGKALAISITTVGLIGVAAGSAFGATRYAAPAPAAIADCSSPGNACGIVTAVGAAGNGDQVVVEPGTYNVSVPITSSATDLDVIGVGTIPGSFTPEVIDTTATPGVRSRAPARR